MDPEDLYKIRLQETQKNSATNEPFASAPEIHDLQLEKALGVLQGVLIFINRTAEKITERVCLFA